MDIAIQALDTTLDASNPVFFEEMFKTHFKGMHAYAATITRDEDAAEEIVQQIFCKLWEKKDRISISESAKSYLYRCVYNESLNYLKHLKVKQAYQAYAVHQMEHKEHTTPKISLRELEDKIGKALNELPEQCRTIFQMSRFEDLKYREIAEELGISVKTVENQMGKALKLMRLKLVDFLPATLLFFLNL